MNVILRNTNNVNKVVSCKTGKLLFFKKALHELFRQISHSKRGQNLSYPCLGIFESVVIVAEETCSMTHPVYHAIYNRNH